MPLTDTAIRAAKPTEKQQKLFDGAGLFLLVFPTGSKIWRLKYRFQGKEKLISLGQYPAVSLKDARERAMEARKLLEHGKDPSIERKISKQRIQNSFESIAREWHEKQKTALAEESRRRYLKLFEDNVFQYIGNKPISEIAPRDILNIVKKIEDRGSVTTAHTVRALCSRIFRYAVVTDRAERDPAADIIGSIAPRTIKNRAAITDPDEVGKLLLKIAAYTGTFTVRNALRFLCLTFCRPGEVRLAEWSEIDFEEKLWRIPAEKMKKRRDHIVPLSTQALALLEEMKFFSGNGKYVFPSTRKNLPVVASTIFLSALRYMGVPKEIMCAHGFRAMASTLLNEKGFHSDIIERQLAHVDQNKVRAAYNRAEYLEERREMMQFWADYLDELREKARQTAEKIS